LEKAGIVAFAFGASDSILSNQRIADIARHKAKALNVRVYTQLDIQVGPGIEVEYTTEEPGKPPPTLRIARGAIQWAKREGIAVLWVVAAKPHLRRCERDLREAVKEEEVKVAIRVCSGIDKFSDEEWFCPDSTQSRTRSRKDWERRENILALLPFFVYKSVAS
jgi:hypothetical protein